MSAEREASEENIIRDLTAAIMNHYGYTDADIEEADLIHPGRICREDECYDENGMSVHCLDEAAETKAAERLAVVEALADDYARMAEHRDTHAATRPVLREVADNLRAALRLDPDEASTP